MSMNDVMNTALAVKGRRRPIMHKPMFVGKALGSVARFLPTPPLTPDAVEFIAAPAVADDADLRRVLNTELTSLRDGLRTYMG
jgi:hypothetical protein